VKSARTVCRPRRERRRGRTDRHRTTRRGSILRNACRSSRDKLFKTLRSLTWERTFMGQFVRMTDAIFQVQGRATKEGGCSIRLIPPDSSTTGRERLCGPKLRNARQAATPSTESACRPPSTTCSWQSIRCSARALRRFITSRAPGFDFALKKSRVRS
jgi:hypothetical protein